MFSCEYCDIAKFFGTVFLYRALPVADSRVFGAFLNIYEKNSLEKNFLGKILFWDSSDPKSPNMAP